MEERSRSRRRTLRARACLLAVTAMLGGGAALAPGALGANVEGGNAFNELSSRAQQEESTTSTATTRSTGSESEAHNSSTTIFIGLGAAALLLLAIAVVIVRDARRVAPAGAEDLTEGRSARENLQRHRKRRARARAARAQRKKNR